MKKFFSAILTFYFLFLFCGCGNKLITCSHIWNASTCTSPPFCDKCGETRGSTLNHNFSPATCTTSKKCTRCGESSGIALGHNFSDGVCTRCSVVDPSYISANDIFPGTPKLSFYMNSAGGINFYWKHNYTGNKKINYITVTYTLYDAVGNPTPDDIRHNCTDNIRLIGPFEANKTIEFNCDVFVYCDVCDKISFDTLFLEYADGTTATVRYGWETVVN